jgi:hypothetical protein
MRRSLLDRIGPLTGAVRSRNLLQSRGYPWCFFTENTLKKFLLLETG